MEETQVAETTAEPKKQDLYARHIEGFVKVAERDMTKALAQYGFTVWHSLPPKEAAVLKDRVGVQKLGAPDYYNRGTANALEGKWSAAEADLRAALKADADYAPAAFNLAVCLEKIGRIEDARATYRHYLTILDRARGRHDLRLGSDSDVALETARVHQHLETLGKA